MGETPTDVHSNNNGSTEMHNNTTDARIVTNGEPAEITTPQQNTKKSRPTPESVAMDRGVQNIARKAHKNNKGDDKKLVDLLVHVFDSLDTPEKKMEALARKYVQLAADQKSTEQKLDEFENKHTKVRKEKDHLQGEFNKLMMTKGKLESLCRELQKHNKQIKEEAQTQTEEEDRKRKELSQKFQSTINDITAQMTENHAQNQQLKQDNMDLATKMKGLVEQYEIREQHIEKVLKAKQLEVQLCEAKVQQQQLLVQEEMETNLKEKQGVVEESLIYKKKCEELLHTEAELRTQLSIYTEKFNEFQTTLTKSNEVFATFKKDMDTMTKTIRKLEKESVMWRTRWENTNHSLLKMVEERTENEQTIAAMNTKVEKLEKLCRALQTERQTLRKQVDDPNGAAAVATGAPEAVAEPVVDVCGTAPAQQQQQQPLSDSELVATSQNDLPEADKELSQPLSSIPVPEIPVPEMAAMVVDDKPVAEEEK